MPERTASFAKLEGQLTHSLVVNTADERRIHDGVALYYNPKDTLGPDHATLALGRLAGHLVREGPNKTIYEAGVGTGAFLVSAAVTAGSGELHIIGNDLSPHAVETAVYNLDQVSRRRPALSISANITQQDWEDALLDPVESVQCGVAHFNPPYKVRGDYLGVAEGTTAPQDSIYATTDEYGRPRAYDRYLPGLYRQLADDGVALVRLPDWEDLWAGHFDAHIDMIQEAAFQELGLRYNVLQIEVPQKTPIEWGGDHKWIPYRTACAMIVARQAPAFLIEHMETPSIIPFDDNMPPQYVIYRDIQYRMSTALGGSKRLIKGLED